MPRLDYFKNVLYYNDKVTTIIIDYFVMFHLSCLILLNDDDIFEGIEIEFYE